MEFVFLCEDSVFTQEFSKKRYGPFVPSLTQYLDRDLSHGHFRMIARGANQDRHSLILRTAPDCNHGLFLKLNFCIAVDGARQRT